MPNSFFTRYDGITIINSLFTNVMIFMNGKMGFINLPRSNRKRAVMSRDLTKGDCI